MRHTILLTTVALAALPAAALAMPQYAAREGKPCSHCHADPGGGGARNVRGQYYEAHDYSFDGFVEQGEAVAAQGGSPIETLLEALSFSGQMRALYSVAEGPHTAAGSGCESCHASGARAPDQSFMMMQGEIAVSARISESVSFTYSNDLGITRDVYGVIRMNDGACYVKVGAFEVPYGIDEVRDHNALVKARHNLGSNVRDVGIELATQRARYFGSVALLNGRPRFSESSPVLSQSIDQNGTPAVVARGGLMSSRARIGASVLHDNSGEGSQPRETVGGVFGTYYGDRWRVAGEVDIGQLRAGPTHTTNLGFLVQGTLQVAEGLELAARADRFDPDTDTDDDGETWYSVIAERHVSRNASLQARYRIRDEESGAPAPGGEDGSGESDGPANDDAMLLLYIHF